jgi:hypothetical protein
MDIDNSDLEELINNPHSIRSAVIRNGLAFINHPFHKFRNLGLEDNSDTRVVSDKSPKERKNKKMDNKYDTVDICVHIHKIRKAMFSITVVNVETYETKTILVPQSYVVPKKKWLFTISGFREFADVAIKQGGFEYNGFYTALSLIASDDANTVNFDGNLYMFSD